VDKDQICSLIGANVFDEKFKEDVTSDSFFGFPLSPILEAEELLQDPAQKSIAYFSMEFGLAPSVYNTFLTKREIAEENYLRHHQVFSNMRAMDYYHVLPLEKLLDIPIYSGGLGVLAGDTLKSSADLKLSLAGVGVLWNKGYFKQNFWFREGQVPEELRWDPHTYPGLIPLDKYIAIRLNGEGLKLKLWKYYVFSHDKTSVTPLILLDSNLQENSEANRRLTDQLYRSDNAWWKIMQRAILGIGGMRALSALGYRVNKYHLNEGHAALAFLEKADNSGEGIEELREKFAYTCHTPVEAGHDRFALHDLAKVLDQKELSILKKHGAESGEVVNLTLLAMNTSAQVNAVAKKHGEITRLQFPAHKEKIQSITNGVHTFTWLSQPMAMVLDKYKSQIGDWRKDPKLLTQVISLKEDQGFRRDLWKAHQENKKALADFLKYWHFDPQTFTIAWARRIATYKRPSLLLQDTNRLLRMSRRIGPLQIVFAGKAHPQDNLGFTYIDEMLNKIDSMEGDRKSLRVTFLENYDTYIGKLLTSSVDVWLNNPLPPFEASGTSGMKAILNGVLQLSTLDGWVVEAAEASIGRIFGYVPPEGFIGNERDLKLKEDADLLYQALEDLMTLYYRNRTRHEAGEPSEWVDMMINCIGQAGYFNTHRMLEEYSRRIWN